MHVVSSGAVYGAERVIVELSLGQIELGWKPLIFALESRGTPSLADYAASRGVPVLTEAIGQRLLAQRAALCRSVKARGVDVVHSHGYKGDLLVATLRLPDSVRMISTCHGWITTSRKLALYEWADKRALRRFDRVATVSASMRDALVRSGVRCERVTLVENGVDVAIPPSHAASRLRAELNIAPQQRIVVVVSRLDRGKGVADVVNAIGRLVAAGHDVVLAVAGDGEERERLVALAASLGAGDRVRLLGYRSDVGELLAASDVFVTASYSEGLPMTVLEAMAIGVPIVATRVGEIPNVLGEGQFGLLLDSGDVDGLTAAIERVLTDPTVSRVASDARRHYAARYSRAAMLTRYQRLYEAA